MLPLFFNGKFYQAGLNGVHRVADRLIQECDAALTQMEPRLRPPSFVFVPKRRDWGPQVRHIQIVEVPGKCGQLWEQFLLPWRTRHGVLVNLANLSPIAHRRKITMIHDVQFLFPDNGYPARQRIGYKITVPLMAKTSATVLTVSDYSRQMMDLFNVCPRASSRVLYNGVDHILSQAPDETILGRLGVQRDRYVVLFGSHKQYKNNQVIFDAAERLSEVGIRVVVIGTNKQTLISNGYSVADQIVFAGKVSDGEVRSLYVGALCLAFPSRTEGFGLPPLEAMLCGCPVVVAPAGAMPEVCGDAVCYARIDDPMAWADAILRLREPKLRAEKIKRGKAQAETFTWARAGAKLMAETMRLCNA